MAEDVVDHRLDHRLGVVAKHELEDGDVGSSEARRPAEASESPRRPVESDVLRRLALVAQDFVQAAQALRGHPLVGVQLRPAPAEAPPRASESDSVLSLGHPLRERRGLMVAVVQNRGGVDEVDGEQTSFVGGQHGSLRNCGAERGYRAGASNSVVFSDCLVCRQIAWARQPRWLLLREGSSVRQRMKC